jgi:hypothetical protein
MVVVCTDDTGKWGTKGIFAAITAQWPEVAADYLQKLPAMGTCMLTKIEREDDIPSPSVFLFF